MLRRGWDAWCVFWARARRNRNENENEPRQGGGASASKKLLAAFAVLAVMFAAFAVVMPAIDESDAATSVGAADPIGDDYKVTYYPKPANKDQAVGGNQALDVKYENNTFTFDGFVTPTAGQWATIVVSGLPTDKVVTEKNPALTSEGQTQVNTNNKAGSDGTYKVIVPRGIEGVVTLDFKDASEKDVKLTFDFTEVSTKQVLSSDITKGTNAFDFGFSTANGLTLENYTGKDLFYYSGDLTVTLKGTNTISAYGNPDYTTGNGSSIINAKNITIKADGDNASLKSTQNTVGAFNISAQVADGANIVIGETAETAKKVTLTAEGGNRALYARGSITINNSDLTLIASEKTIRSNGTVEIVKSTVSAKLDGTGQQNGDDPDKGLYGIISNGNVTVGQDSKVDAQSLYAKGTDTGLIVVGEIVVGNAIVDKVTMSGGSATFNGTLTGQYDSTNGTYKDTKIDGTAGTAVLGSKVDLNKITKTGNAGITVDPSAMEDMIVGGTTTGKDSNTVYPINQIVTVTGSWTLAPGANITIQGQFVLPADATLTIQNGASLTLDPGSVSKIDGKVVIEEGDSNATEAAKKDAGIFNANGKVSVTGSVQSFGNIVIGGEFSIEADAVVSVEDTGSILTAADSKLTVKDSGALEIRGAFTGKISGDAVGLIVYNHGLVTIDSEEAAVAASQIYQMASGAVVDVVNYTVDATTGTKNLTITDAQLAPAKGKADVIGDKANQITISATATATPTSGAVTDTQNADSLATVSGIKIVEDVVSKSSKPTDSAFVEISSKYYIATMDVSGSIAVSAQYKGTDSVTVTGTAAVDFTGKTGIVVSDGAVLSVGAKVTVTNTGVMNVAGKVESVVKGDTGNAALINSVTVGDTTTNGTITVTGNGSVRSNTALTGIVNATNYQTTEGTSKIENYVTLDAALAMVNADGNTVKQLNIIGANKVTASATLPADVTAKQDAGEKNVITIGEKAGDDVTLTIAKGAVFKNNGKTVVNGTLYAEDKTNVKGTDIISDVYSEQIGEDGKAVRNGWAQWTNLVNALNGAEAGQTITISKDKEAGDVEIAADTEIKAGVTLKVPSDTATLLLKNGVTLTVNGKLITEQAIKAENSFDVEARNVAKATDNSSAVIVNGVFASTEAINYGYVAPIKGTDGKYTPQANTAGAPIAGAYYATKDYDYVVSPLTVAIASIADIEGEIAVKGAVSEGDIAFAATEGVKKIAIGADILANPAKTVTSLTVASLTLSEGAAVTGGVFNGSIIVGANTVTLKGANGLSAAEKSEKLVLDGTLIVNVKDGSFQVAAGTAVANGLTIVAGEKGKASVAAGATLEAGKSGIVGIDAITVDGTLSVPATYNAKIDTLVVNGAVSVATATSEKTAGTLKITELYVGMDPSVYDKSATAASASVSGPITVDDSAYIMAGSALDEDAQKSIEALENSTVFNVNGKVWFTVYAKGTDKTITVDKAPITDAILAGWTDKNGKLIVGADSKATFEVTVGGDNEKVDAVIKTDIYNIVIKADEGIADVYLNGQAMYYGIITVGDVSYYAYFATVSAGDYKVTYTLKNGWSGEAKLTGDNVTGTSFKATGTPASGQDSIQLVYQLSGVEKSGYVEPVTPSEDNGDDGLTITDYLLIVLVVLIVIMAVIVAMRLMRS